MSRPRKPSRILSHWRNFQTAPFSDEDFTRFTADQERELYNLYIPELKGDQRPSTLIHGAICRARMERKKAPISQAEVRAIYEDQARLAEDLLRHIEMWPMSDLIDSRSADDVFEYPLIKYQPELRKCLRALVEDAGRRAEQIDTSAFRRNRHKHVLAEGLCILVRQGILPMKLSSSKTSRLAQLFEWCCGVAGFEPGDPAEYLKDK